MRLLGGRSFIGARYRRSELARLAGSPRILLTKNTCSSNLEHMFGSRLILIGVVLLALLLAALGAARPTSGAAPETRYVVEAGDTLWEIAKSYYDGDPREAIWRIEQRNDLRGATLQPGQELVLP